MGYELTSETLRKDQPKEGEQYACKQFDDDPGGCHGQALGFFCKQVGIGGLDMEERESGDKCQAHFVRLAPIVVDGKRVASLVQKLQQGDADIQGQKRNRRGEPCSVEFTHAALAHKDSHGNQKPHQRNDNKPDRKKRRDHGGRGIHERRWIEKPNPHKKDLRERSQEAGEGFRKLAARVDRRGMRLTS